MKYILLVIAIILAIAIAYPVNDAEDESDIKTFRGIHLVDTAVLYFYKKSGPKDTGFWASIFSIFSSSSEDDVTYLKDISDNAPVMTVDVGLERLKHSADDYKISSYPYVVVFHRDEEILRETPKSSTADKIEEKVKEKEEKKLKEINVNWTVHPERNGTTATVAETKKDEKKETDEHHHPKPLTIVPDFGHMTATHDPAESNLIGARPIQQLDEKLGTNQADGKPAPPTGITDDQLIKYKQIGEAIYTDPKAAAQKYVPEAAYAAYNSRYGTKSAQPPLPPSASASGSASVSKIGHRLNRYNHR